MLGIAEILNISKIFLVINMVAISICAMIAASRTIMDIPPNDILIFLHLGIAGVLSASGSSALNNYCDKDIDSMVPRTRSRAIPIGRINSSYVLLYGIITSCASVVYGFFTLNPISTFFIAFGIFAYVVIYTMWLKRKTKINTLIGGISSATVVWTGWSAATGSIDLLGFFVGSMILLWITTRVWCYSLIIRDEYIKTDIPILSASIGMKKTTQYMFVVSIIILINALIIGLMPGGMGLIYIISATIMISIMIVNYYRLVKDPTPKFASTVYKTTSKYLLFTYIALAIDAIFYTSPLN